MIATFHTLVSELLPNWLFHVGHSAHAGSPSHMAPAPYSEAAAAAWLMERERRRRR
jgi:hypothetical protein